MSTEADNAPIEGVPSELDYFEKNAFQTAIVSEYDRDINPTGALQEGSPIEFIITGADRLYLDLNNSKLQVKVKITLANSNDLAVGNVVGPVNLMLHSLFSKVDMSLCGKEVSDPSSLYPYRAYLETLLNYNGDVLKTRHYAEGWDKDLSTEIAVPAADGANTALARRRRRYVDSTIVTLIGRLHLDLFHQDKLIPPHCELKIRLERNQPAWVLMNVAPTQNNPQENYRISIQSARLLLRTKEISSSMALAHELMLQKTNYRIQFTRVEPKRIHIPQGGNNFTFGNVYTGELPDRVVVAFVRDDALTGSFILNPFNFEHNDVNSLVLKVNGEQVPRVGLEPNFATGDYLREYMYTLESLGYDIGEQMIDITPAEWAAGFTVFVFKVTPGPTGNIRTAPRTGYINLDVKFANPTQRNISAILLSSRPSAIEIDKYHQVILT